MERKPMPDMTIARWERDGIRWFTIPSFAEFLKVSAPQVRRWIQRNKLPCRRIGRRIVILLFEVQPLIPLIWRWLGRPDELKPSRVY